jgi:hypothetical protein
LSNRNCFATRSAPPSKISLLLLLIEFSRIPLPADALSGDSEKKELANWIRCYSERSLRAVALGRKNYLFAGSDAGGERAAAIYSLIGSAAPNSTVLTPKPISAMCCPASPKLF